MWVGLQPENPAESSSTAESDSSSTHSAIRNPSVFIRSPDPPGRQESAPRPRPVSSHSDTIGRNRGACRRVGWILRIALGGSRATRIRLRIAGRSIALWARKAESPCGFRDFNALGRCGDSGKRDGRHGVRCGFPLGPCAASQRAVRIVTGARRLARMMLYLGRDTQGCDARTLAVPNRRDRPGHHTATRVQT